MTIADYRKPQNIIEEEEEKESSIIYPDS